jgi:spartin
MSSAVDHNSKGIEILVILQTRATQHYQAETVELASGTLQVLLVSIEFNDAVRQTSGLETIIQDQSTDLWLVLSIGPSFTGPVPANQIVRPKREQDGNSYVFPSLDLAGAYLKFTIPADTDTEDISNFEQILSQYAAFEDDDLSDAGKIELMDEDGKVLGVLQANFNVREDASLSDAGNEKSPVLIELPPEPFDENQRQDLQVGVLSAHEGQDWMIKGANLLSRAIVRSSQYVGGKIQGAADSYVSKMPAAGSLGGTITPVGEKEADGPACYTARDPMKVGPLTQASVRTLHGWSGTAVHVSSKTTGAIIQVAGMVGDKIGQKTGIQRKVRSDGTLGPAPKGVRGFINRSLIAANTVLDGVDAGAQTLLYTSGDAASKFVGHKYGPDAQHVADGVARTGKNVFLVYKDFRGVRRNALLKAARSRAFKARLDDGSEVTVQVGDDGHAAASPPSAGDSAQKDRTTATAISMRPILPQKRSVASDPLHRVDSTVSSAYATPPAYASANRPVTSSLPPPPSHPSVKRSPSPKS